MNHIVTVRFAAVFTALCTVACVNDLGELETGGVAAAGAFEEGEETFALSRTCADGGTVKGIDVSHWQGTINWDRVAGDGVEYAFIRVSDGVSSTDRQFVRNWSEAKRVGIRRGAYIFFRPNREPINQADLFLSRLGPLEPGDLPPVIDVEATGGLSPTQVALRARQFVERVEAALGVKAIVYTGPYFWRDSVGGPSWAAEHKLWVAHYTSGCPLTPAPWSAWTWHQYTDNGRVDGISGPVDMNHFNGSLADLDALTVGGEPPPPPPACESLPASGGLLEEDDACVDMGGNPQYLRTVSGGSGGSYVWTGTINGSANHSDATYRLDLDAAGTYDVEVFISAGTGSTESARYVIEHAGGSDTVVVDQKAANGWTALGTFDFAAGAGQSINIGDNTGEPSSRNRRVVFDALRIFPSDGSEPEPEPDTTGNCEDIDDGATLEEDGACATLGGPSQYLRAEDGGSAGAHVTTGATASGNTYNFIEWTLPFTTSGRYLVEVFVPPGATSERARYFVSHAGQTTTVTVDQSANSGFVELGIFDFNDEVGQKVFLGDNTGEPSSQGKRIGMDAVRVTPASDEVCASVRISAGSLNVRPIPSTSQSALGQLSSGDTVTRISTVEGQSIAGERDWYRIPFAGTTGYISARFASCL